MIVLPGNQAERHAVANELLRLLLVWSSCRCGKPRGSGRGINARAELGGMEVVQSYLQTNTRAPIRSARLFLPSVTSKRRKATETVG